MGRRELLTAACAAAVLRAISALPTAAQDEEVIAELVKVPTTGAARAGPVIVTTPLGL